VLVTGLTLGDYLLWNSSLDSGRDVLAIISGLSLPPLAIVWLWLVGLTVARALTPRPRAVPVRRRTGDPARGPASSGSPAPVHGASRSAGSAASSGKLAA
jgi:hypothetical protein